MASSEERDEIAFFDLETTMPSPPGQHCAILEFGSILVCPRKLVELESYSTLVRPSDLSLIASLTDRKNGISRDAVVSAPTFRDIADTVYDILHGRIWAGHNILRFDCILIREAFADIGRPAPEPKGAIDSLALLTERFGGRAGDMKMATLATYFGLGQQTHRSLGDVRMNLEVLKYCATVLFLESSLPVGDCSGSSAEFLDPNEVSIPSISASLLTPYRRSQKIKLLHNDNTLQLQCTRLKVRFGISAMFVDHAGRPRLNFVVDATPGLCGVLDSCIGIAQELSLDSGSGSEWRPVVNRESGFNYPTVRIHIPNEVGEIAIYQKENSGSVQRLVFSKFDASELNTLFTPGIFVDAFFSVDPYDYQQNAGIRLVAKKLIIHSGG